MKNELKMRMVLFLGIAIVLFAGAAGAIVTGKTISAMNNLACFFRG